MPLPAIALGTDMAALTCIANDFGYESVFARQLEALAAPRDAETISAPRSAGCETTSRGP